MLYSQRFATLGEAGKVAQRHGKITGEALVREYKIGPSGARIQV
jgi:hypothetical protein